MKNLQIIKRKLKDGGFSYTARLRQAGFPTVCKTFPTEKEAREWGEVQKGEIIKGTFQDFAPLKTLTLSEILDFWEPIAKTKKSYSNALGFRIEKWRERPICRIPVGNLKAEDFAEYARKRQRDGVSGGTIRNELTVLFSAWSAHPATAGRECPGKHVFRQLKPAKKRDRRLEKEEQKYLLDALQNTDCSDPARANRWVVLVVKFAIESAARLSEIINLQWGDVAEADATAFLRETKNGTPRFCPLSVDALGVLWEARKLGGGEVGQVFKTTQNAIKLSWNRARKRARLKYKEDGGTDENFLVDFRFHDLRHEAASRWAVHIDNVLDLQQVTGHRDLRSLQRYVNKNKEDAIRIAKKMAAARNPEGAGQEKK